MPLRRIDPGLGGVSSGSSGSLVEGFPGPENLLPRNLGRSVNGREFTAAIKRQSDIEAQVRLIKGAENTGRFF